MSNPKYLYPVDSKAGGKQRTMVDTSGQKVAKRKVPHAQQAARRVYTVLEKPCVTGEFVNRLRVQSHMLTGKWGNV